MTKNTKTTTKITIDEKDLVELETMVCWLWSELYQVKSLKAQVSRPEPRKLTLLAILQDGKPRSIKELAEMMSERTGVVISRKNVSSLLTYLRDDIESGQLKGQLAKLGRGHGKVMFIKE